jgi:hypothetical protein
VSYSNRWFNMMISLQSILQITHINLLPVAQIYRISMTTFVGWEDSIKPGRNGQK